MNELHFNVILSDCLQAIENGQMSPAECLERYPQHRQELVAYFGLASRLRRIETPRPSQEFRFATRARLMNIIAGEQQNPSSVTFLGRIRLWVRESVNYFSANRRRTMTFLSILTIVATIISGGGVALASGQSLPGETLYPIKTAIENTQLIFANDSTDATLLAKFAQERAQEIELLMSEGDYEDIPATVSAYIAIAKELANTLYDLSQQDWQSREVELTQEMLSISTQTLVSLLGLVPDDVKPYINQAIYASQAAQQVLEGLINGKTLEPPIFDLPPLDITPGDLPEIITPEIDIPPLEIPDIEIPPIDELPEIDIPPVEVPELSMPYPAGIELPSMEDIQIQTLSSLESLSLPAIQFSGIELP